MSSVYYSQIKRGVGVLAAMCMGGCSITGLTCFAKNTIFLSKYTNYMELHGVYGPVEPSDELRRLVDDSKEEIKDHISSYTKIEPVIVPGMKTLHAGTIGTHYGGIIGLPTFFEYSRMEDIQDGIQVKDVDFYGGDVEKVYESYLLSEAAKKYAIAREILLVNTYQVYIDTVIPYSVFYVTYFATQFAKNNLPPLPITPSLARFGIYSFFTLLGLSLWRIIHSSVKSYNESEAEEAITSLGLKYINGGIEYLTKEQERNSCSAVFKNQDSRILKTVEDYVYNKFVLNHISLQKRMAFLKAHKRKMESESESVDLVQPI